MTDEINAPVIVPEKEPRISEKSAKASVDEILKHYRIKFDHIVNDQGKDGAKTWYNKMVEAFRDELLETRQDSDPEKGFQIVQHTTTGKEIVYNEYGFKAAREYAKQKDSTSGQFSLLGSLSGKEMSYFESKKNFSGGDLRLSEAIVLVFFF